MNGHRFDDLVRATASASRRGVVKSLVAAGLVSSVPRTSRAAATGTPSRAAGGAGAGAAFLGPIRAHGHAAPEAVQELPSGVRVDVIGGTADVGNCGLAHGLLRVWIDPEVEPPDDARIDADSAVLSVEDGTLLLTVSDAATDEFVVDVGRGEPIRSPKDAGGEVLCDRGSCAIKVGQDVVLGPGNAASLAAAGFEVRNWDSVPLVFLVARVACEECGCWICPRPPR